MAGGIGKNAINKLGEAQIQAFIRKSKAGISPKKKLSDGGGMYLTVTPAGTPVWRLKYRLGGKELTYTIGTLAAYPLADARKARDAAKALIHEGKDPVKAREVERAAAIISTGQTLSSLTADWLASRKQGWSAIHYEKSKRALERDVLPRLGSLPVASITPTMVAGAIEAVVRRGALDTATKILQHIVCVFKLGQARGLRDDNPGEPVHEVVPAPKERQSYPAITTFPTLGELLRAAEAANLSSAVRMAHRLLAFSVVRVSNVVEARWSEFELDGDVPTWIIPRAQMKRKRGAYDHKVMLGATIASELRQWHQQTGGKGYLFRSRAGTEHISREALEKAYRETLNLRGRHSPHSWRSAFSTLARDNGFALDVVELALDHIHANEVVRAYDRGERLEQRIKLAAWWGEQLDLAQRGAEVVPLRKIA